ncbi:hypothetical protein HWI79_3771 [Cryptosporidium felis]|nr:hypothetical protein HWI79_3771 [Cryptosporidium felis]
MAPTIPTDSSLIGDVWRKLYIDKQIATSTVNEVDAKISILSDMCSRSLRNLKQKKNYYGEQLYKMSYSDEESIEIFCHDVARRWFSKWPSEVSSDILLMKPDSVKIREGFPKVPGKISPFILEELNISQKRPEVAPRLLEVPSELCDQDLQDRCKHKTKSSSISFTASSINIPPESKILGAVEVSKLNYKGKYNLERKESEKRSAFNLDSIKLRGIGNIGEIPDLGAGRNKEIGSSDSKIFTTRESQKFIRKASYGDDEIN